MKISELYELYLQHPSIQTDTRKLKKGDIYFALKGAYFDGNSFVVNALQIGASYSVTDDHQYSTIPNCILVENALETLQQLALFHRKQLTIPFIAITGSNGKTTTKELIATTLSKRYRTIATEGNLNNHIGVPLTLLKIPLDAEIAIIEMGANHRYEIDGYCKIAHPDYGIITNCGKAHLEGFGSLEGVRIAKGELYDFIRSNRGTIFRNSGLEYLETMASGIKQQITFGTQNADYIGRVEMDGAYLEVIVTFAEREEKIKTHLVGDYNYSNVMAAVAVGLYFGVSLNLIKVAIESYVPSNNRSQWVQRGTNNLILDAYNANATSMSAAIQNFANSALPNKIIWLGGMKEMGNDENEEHEELVKLIGAYKWQDVILVGKEFKAVHGNYKWFNDSVEASTFIKTHKPENSTILIKGSRGTKMELMLAGLD